MRILVVNWQDRANPQAGGAEEHVHEVFGRIAARGHEVSLLVSGFDGCAPRTRIDGMEVHRTGSRYMFSVAAPLYHRDHLQARAFDVVVECLNKVPVFSPQWSGTPVVALVHHLFGVTAFSEANVVLASATWTLERFIPWAYRGLPTIAISHGTRDDLLARGLRDPISVIPVGVDVDLYSSCPSAPKSERPTLLYLGRLKRYKGIDLLVHAVAELADQGLDLDLLIAGAGDWRQALENLVDGLGITERVTFLGFVDHNRKLSLMNTSWVHGLTSPKEGWGITVVEAGACGTPSVASDSPGLREAIVDRQTGLLVPHGDVSALCEAIRRLVTDSALRKRLGAGARRHAESLSWDSASIAVERILAAAASGSGPS